MAEVAATEVPEVRSIETKHCSRPSSTPAFSNANSVGREQQWAPATSALVRQVLDAANISQRLQILSALKDAE